MRESIDSLYAPSHLLLTDSGTTALRLAFRAISRDWPRRPVALPAYSCYDLATAAVAADVPVLFYDLDPETLGPSLESLERVLREGVAAVVLAHLYGIPVDLDPVLELTETAEVAVVEDAAQGAGAQIDGRPLGSFGSLSVLSFGRGKGTTGCGGGALLAHDPRGRSWIDAVQGEVGERTRRGVGQLPELVGQWLFGRPVLYSVPAALPFLNLGETVYREPRPARGVSNLSAGVLRGTLRLQADELRHRRRNAETLRRWMSSADGLKAITPPEGSTPSYLRLPVLAKGTMIEVLTGDESRSLGVMPGYPKRLDQLRPMQSQIQANEHSAWPGAEALTRQLFTFPTHSRLTEEGLSRLADLVES